MADLNRYSLVLEKHGAVLYSSDKSGLRPLMECVARFMGKQQGCTLHDRVVGLAAARLIAHSGMITEVNTPVASEQAKSHLCQAGIALNAGSVVPKILNKDRTAMCPMERRAQDREDRRFYEELRTLLMQ